MSFALYCNQIILDGDVNNSKKYLLKEAVLFESWEPFGEKDFIAVLSLSLITFYMHICCFTDDEEMESLTCN